MRARLVFLYVFLILTILSAPSCKPKLDDASTILENPDSVLTANAVEVQTLSAGLQKGVAQQAGTISAVITQAGQQAAQSATTPQPLNSTQIQLNQSGTQQLPTVYTYKITPAKTSSVLGTSITPTMTRTATSDISQQAGWSGSWTAYLEQTNGTYLSGPMTVTVLGNTLQGTANLGGTTMTVTSDLSGSSNTIYGAYSSGTGNGAFAWLQISDQSFKGNIDNKLAFCASRPGGVQPDPCGYFLPS